jgi:hypothetical protein
LAIEKQQLFAVQIVEKVVFFLGNFLFSQNLIPHLMTAPANGSVNFRSGHSLSAGSSWSLLGAFGACGVSSDLSIPQESSALRFNQHGAN